jgi:hypothetical protein
MRDSAIQSLVDLGFTDLEARAYAFLLTESPATAYRVAQGTGKPVANTYKALDTLATRSAVMVDEGQTRLYRAVPLDDLLRDMERSFASRKAQARRELADVASSASDARVYQLATPDAVYAHAQRLIEGAQSKLVCDLFPEPARRLAPLLESAAGRCGVAMQGYEPISLRRVTTATFGGAPAVLDAVEGHLIVIVADRSELLMALLSPDGLSVSQAIVTASPFIASMIDAYLTSELITSRVIADARVRNDQSFMERLSEEGKPFRLAPGEPLVLTKPPRRRTSTRKPRSK